jgi:Uma2 family endonuclease
MSTLPKTHLTPEQYLEIERQAETKSEYYQGEMFAMAGVAEPHNLIVTNLGGQLYLQLRTRPCRYYSHDMRVLVPARGLYTYPDAIVACGERKFLDDTHDTLLNPTVIFEVLSKSTEAYDRGRKFDHYSTLESRREYVLIAADRVSIDLFTRQPAGPWVLTKADNLEASVELTSIGCGISVTDLYENVEFPDAPQGNLAL